ncbi:uncharacterized protein LOC103963034 isoform X3 [Pyrus x bretschneideri]|uniref:uncharacterized protein LOC103963034 isoform X3 n=1 Tax=Pyrus x bretschneideri TaxID=225117 RepID=UPI00202EF7C7|nr:uncharacterized protein LOC103963034 isoform X3 [Pyrus x bretschneideri]
MARSKAPAKKQQKRGIDFKKIRRKIGRKLPPPKNATNTEIKSKAIVLPEQSVASEKAGLAVNKKGLTLKELLQQTSHYNPKVRKDALLGMKDLLLRYPEELRLHKYAVVEKLRERIGDDNRLVRDTLYQLFKSVILPGCKEDNQELLISLMMAYIFNAMTHLAIDVRLMAFKFLELAIQYHPPSFFLNAEKILQSFEDILQRNQFFLEDKGKLKTALAGLELCLSLLPCNKREVGSCEKNGAGQGILHAFEPDVLAKSAGCSIIIPKLKDLVPVLVNCFQDFIPEVQTGSLLNTQSFDCMLSILNSINLAVKFFFYMTDEGKLESQPSQGGHGVTMCDTISVTLVKTFLQVLFPLNMRNQLSEKDDVKYFVLNTLMTEIFLHLSKWICPPPVLFEKILEFLEDSLLGKVCNDTLSGKAVWEKHLISLLPFVPKLVYRVADDWKSRLLQAFSEAFKDCNPVSPLKLACLSILEELLVPRQDMLYLDPSISEILDFQITWIRELPVLLILLGDKNPYYSQVVLHLLLRLGQRALVNSSFAWEYDNMQLSLQEFFGISKDDGNVLYGPFVRLPRDSQELSLSCLCYISNLGPLLLKSIAYCCLCPDLEQYVLFRIIEVLNSAYKSGHIQIVDHISFLITLLSHFRVFPENIVPDRENDVNISNRGTFKSLSRIVCSCLSQMGDNTLVLQMLEKIILDQMCIVEDDKKTTVSISSSSCRYYLIPCFVLFDKSHELLNLVLNTLGSWITESSLPHVTGDHTHYATDISSMVDAVVFLLQLMHMDDKICQIISSFKAEIDYIMEGIRLLQSSAEIRMTIEEKHKVQCALGRLQTVIITLHSEMQSV